MPDARAGCDKDVLQTDGDTIKAQQTCGKKLTDIKGAGYLYCEQIKVVQQKYGETIQWKIVQDFESDDMLYLGSQVSS